MNNKKQRNRLFTMLLLVMAILMPYGGMGTNWKTWRFIIIAPIPTNSLVLRWLFPSHRMQ